MNVQPLDLVAPLLLNPNATICRISKRRFLRNVAILSTGTAGAQVIAMAFSPLITRIHGPEAFGLLGTFAAIVGVLASISALCYPIAIVLPTVDGDAKRIARLSIYISMAVATVLIFAILIGGDRLLEMIGAKAIAAFALLIPLNVLLSAWVQVARQWLIRKSQFQNSFLLYFTVKGQRGRTVYIAKTIDLKRFHQICCTRSA